MSTTTRTLGVFLLIAAIALAAAYLTAGGGLGNVAITALVAFVGGYLCHATEADTP